MMILMIVDGPEEKRKFLILYEQYRYLMLKVAVDILHDYQLAEDAVQEAFVRVAKHMEQIGQPQETATKRYLITITKHAAIIQRLEEGEEKDYVFTNHFIKAMNRLIQRETYMDAAKLVKRITQRAAVIVLVMLLGALAVPMSVKAYQAQLFHTIETHTDTSAVLEYSKADRHLIYNQKIITNEKMIFDMSFDRVERIGVNGMTVIISILIVLFTGCGKENAENHVSTEQTQTNVTEVCAYIRAIKGDVLVIDPVEYISSEDSDRLASYKHTEDDMPDGYYLYNEDEETEQVTLTAQTEYSFLDWTREFGGTDEDIRVIKEMG